MELYQLGYFRAIAESKSMHEASKKLHVSQPSLSRCIKSLEEELGTPVFDRVGRSLVLNGAGEVLLRQANVTLAAADSIHKEIDAFMRSREQTVNLYSPVPLGEDVKVLMGFKKAHPDIRLRVGMGGAEQLMGETPDLTFFASPFPHDGPNYLELGQEDMVLFASSESEVADAESVALGDLDGRDFVLNMPSALRDLVDGMFSQVDIQPHIVMENQSIEHIMAFVSNGFGYAVGPAVTWWSSNRSGHVRVPFSDVYRKRYLYLKWQESDVLSSSACMLRDHIAEHYRRIASSSPFFTAPQVNAEVVSR